MRLVPVSPKPSVSLVCCRCAHQGFSDTDKFSADTEGTPFVDYYCRHCAATLLAGMDSSVAVTEGR